MDLTFSDRGGARTRQSAAPCDSSALTSAAHCPVNSTGLLSDHAGKYTCCIAEKEEDNPWQPLHVERGFQKDDSTVTVFASAAPQSINDHGNNTATGILDTICANLTAPGNSGGETLLVIGVEHAKTISGDGFSKADVRAYISEKTQQQYRAEALILMVAGGPAGRWTIAVPGWGSPTSRAVTLAVRG